MWMDCWARALFETGSAKVTWIGMATPTTSPDDGVMAVTARSDLGPGTAAKPAGAEPTMATAIAPTTTSTYLTALRNASIPSPTSRPAKCSLMNQSVGVPPTSRYSTSEGV